jgi:hypothetical protein
MGCADGNPGDQLTVDAGRDLTTAIADVSDSAVVSDLELGRIKDLTVAVEPAPDAAGAGAESVSLAPVMAPVLVSFTDGLELASEPRMINASLPVLGAGSGTLLRPGVTVAAAGNPIDLFRPTRVGDSPWPEARTGEYAIVSRDGMGLVIGRGGGGGHCPAPGLF